MILPDTATPAVVQTLPYTNISATPAKDKGNLVSMLLNGNFTRAMMHTAGSKRTFGIDLHLGKLGVDFSFRVASEDDRQDLLEILQNPARASYEADTARR